MTEIYTYPPEWYEFSKIAFPLRSMSQASPRPWAGGNSVYGPHAQLWLPKLTVGTIHNQRVWREMGAFFSRLGGQSGLLRIGDFSRGKPVYNVNRAGGVSTWSDGTLFSDGYGFVSGLLPPTCFLAASASRGDIDVMIGGLPASIADALHRGDLFEVRPNGIPSASPNLYQVMVTGSTDPSGRTGVEIRPPLRMDLAAGDMVVLNDPTSVFHLVDDSQGDMEISAPIKADFGFSLIEAMDQVP